MSTLLIVGVVLVVLAVWQRRNFARVMTVIRSQCGKLVNSIWAADPIAVYQAEVDKATDELRDATSGLEEYKGNIASMERRISKGETEERTLLARIKVSLNNNEEDRAAEYAVQLQQVQKDLASARENYQLHNDAYKNNLEKIKHARKTIDSRKAKARQLNAELKMSKADAQLARTAEKFNLKSTTLDGLGEVEEEINRQIDANKGKAQVAHDLSSEGLAEIKQQEAIDKAEAKELLAKIKADIKL